MRLAIEIIGAVALAITTASWRISEWHRHFAESRLLEYASDAATWEKACKQAYADLDKQEQMYETSIAQTAHDHPSTLVPLEELTIGEDGVARDEETMRLHGITVDPTES